MFEKNEKNSAGSIQSNPKKTGQKLNQLGKKRRGRSGEDRDRDAGAAREVVEANPIKSLLETALSSPETKDPLWLKRKSARQLEGKMVEGGRIRHAGSPDYMRKTQCCAKRQY